MDNSRKPQIHYPFLAGTRHFSKIGVPHRATRSLEVGSLRLEQMHTFSQLGLWYGFTYGYLTFKTAVLPFFLTRNRFYSSLLPSTPDRTRYEGRLPT
jgi:hypothetical protein